MYKIETFLELQIYYLYMSTHSINGVGDDTFVNCPSGLLYGPAEDAENIFNYCPYCGEDTENKNHTVDKEISEVFCDNTIMSTYRFCPNCSVRIKPN